MDTGDARRARSLRQIVRSDRTCARAGLALRTRARRECYPLSLSFPLSSPMCPFSRRQTGPALGHSVRPSDCYCPTPRCGLACAGSGALRSAQLSAFPAPSRVAELVGLAGRTAGARVCVPRPIGVSEVHIHTYKHTYMLTRRIYDSKPVPAGGCFNPPPSVRMASSVGARWQRMPARL